ncbi:MAG: hypothetical protein ETSY1_08420 [Candidatus Entotheonella factor]|uniref:DUF1640 domain-containing protein n=1 Tax=Entotheonella factor TaxID=1429438 RepID=W4LUQ8_ENTF1|nr:MAG: hypothetical protein ETSY1_08420 [Candidatus Entotheonella factor]
MAEDYVSRDQHRADMAELRGELKDELAGVRQEIAVLAKTMEANQQAMMLRFDQINQQMAADRETMLLRFEQVDKRFEQVDKRFEQVDKRFEQVDQQFSRYETRLVSLENWMRTTYVTLAIMAVGVAAQLFYTLLRFGLKPPTP